MSDTPNRGYPIPSPVDPSIYTQVRDALVAVDADVQGIREDSVWSFNEREGAVTLLPADVITALGLLDDDGAFDPNDYAGLLRWYNPDTIGITTGTALASWDDSSAAADPAVQATGTKQPIYHSTGGPNNKQRIVFDGVNDFLSFTELANARTVYLVVKHRTGDQPANSAALLGHDTGFPYVGVTGTKLFSQSGPAAVANGQFFVNGELRDYLNELKSTEYQIYTIVSPSNATIEYLFNDRDVNFWDGDVVEWGFSSEAHSKTVRHLHEAYLADAARFDRPLSIQSQPPASTKILYSGNSILAGGEIQTNVKRAMHPSTVSGATENWAVGGRTTQQMASAASSSEDLGFDATKEANILIAWEITNDLANTDLSATTTTAAANAAYADIAAYYTARKAAHPSLKVIATTCLPRNSNLTGTNMTPADFETMRLSVNSQLVTNWQTYADALADVGGDATLGAWSTSKVGMVKITAGGTGYSNSFAVTFTGGAGSGATGTATAVGGVIQSVAMTNYGTGYTSAPTPVFTAGSGSGATATAYLGAGDMTYIGDGTHLNTEGFKVASRVFISAVGELDLGAEGTIPPETVNPGEVLMSTGFTSDPTFGIPGETRGSLSLAGISTKHLTMRVDNNIANFRESAGAAGSLFVLDLATNSAGFGIAVPRAALELSGAGAADGGYFYISDPASVAHGITAIAPTDVFGVMLENSLSNGGLIVRGLSALGSVHALKLDGMIGATSTSVAAVQLRGFKKSGTSIASLAATEFACQVLNNATVLMTWDGGGNAGLGVTAFGTSALKVLGIGTGTAPTTGPADMIQIYSSDESAGHTVPSFFTEGSNALLTGQSDVASSRRVQMRINGTLVKLLAE